MGNSIEKIVDFIQEYKPNYFDREKIKEYVALHFQFKTAFVVYDAKDKIVAVCRWNLLENDTKTLILDFIIRYDYREKWGNRIFKQMLQRGLWLFPKVMEVGWERSRKPNDRGIRFYKIDKLLRRR